jgi:DNA-binding transcriptional regulator LsrR (DeoR family)/DNA-binding XRE family transcriptional regulator
MEPNEQKSADVKYDLGRRLRELRRVKSSVVGSELSQEAVAQDLGVRYATYNGWENSHTTPRSVNDWCKLADYFNVTIDYLIRGDHAPSVYMPLREREDRGIRWRLTMSELSDGQASAVKVFSLFAEGRSDAEIMDIMKADMSGIQDMLLDATRDGPIEITGLNRDQDLEEALKQKYKGHEGLMDARVFSIGETNPIFDKILVGWGAKEYLLEELHKPFASRMLIGIAGGTTLANMFRFIKRGECPHTTICPLCISPTEVAIGVDPNNIIGDLAYRQQNYIDAFVLPYVSREAKNIMAHAEELPPEVLAARRVLGKAANVDMAFLGVGALDDVMSYMMSEFFRVAGGMTIDEIREKAIGDILYHIVDRKAQIVDQHYDDFLCSIELDVLRDMVSAGKRVVLVTHSGRKEISRAAIEARLVNVVIVDDVLAKSLLEDA